MVRGEVGERRYRPRTRRVAEGVGLTCMLLREDGAKVEV